MTKHKFSVGEKVRKLHDAAEGIIRDRMAPSVFDPPGVEFYSVEYANGILIVLADKDLVSLDSKQIYHTDHPAILKFLEQVKGYVK
jgi:hypothetical protein